MVAFLWRGAKAAKPQPLQMRAMRKHQPVMQRMTVLRDQLATHYRLLDEAIVLRDETIEDIKKECAKIEIAIHAKSLRMEHCLDAMRSADTMRLHITTLIERVNVASAHRWTAVGLQHELSDLEKKETK